MASSEFKIWDLALKICSTTALHDNSSGMQVKPDEDVSNRPKAEEPFDYFAELPLPPPPTEVKHADSPKPL